MDRTRLARRTALAVTLPLLAAPAGASALSTTVTNDAGQPVPADGAALRTMDTTVAFGLAPSEQVRFSATFTGPDGIATASPVRCVTFATNRKQDFRGNGAYKVTVQRYAQDDTNCATPSGQPAVATYTITSRVGLAGPAAPVLFRNPNTLVRNTIPIGVDQNPGSLSTEFRYAANGVVGPDGAISGPSAEGFVDKTTGQAPVRFDAPGRYVVVARAKGFSTASGQFFSPWSAPATVVVQAPFDVERTRFLDARGPSYRISVRLNEKSARGRVFLSAARGTKGGKYRSLGSARLSSQGSFTKRFTLRRTGTYRLRLRFSGSETTQGGTLVQRVRISRRTVFG